MPLFDYLVDLLTSPLFSMVDFLFCFCISWRETQTGRCFQVTFCRFDKIFSRIVRKLLIFKFPKRLHAYQLFIVLWKDGPLTDCSWIDVPELRLQGKDLYQRLSIRGYYLGSSSNPQRIDLIQNVMICFLVYFMLFSFLFVRMFMVVNTNFKP